jgi:hypothetical protein
MGNIKLQQLQHILSSYNDLVSNLSPFIGKSSPETKSAMLRTTVLESETLDTEFCRCFIVPFLFPEGFLSLSAVT